VVSEGGARGDSQAAYFARWLSGPSNNIGFRNDQEQHLVVGGRLPFAIGANDPAGIAFRNSGEPSAWLRQSRAQQVAQESHARWQVRKNEYDACMHENDENCRNPGLAPQH
jgi:hypothetical protein